MSCENYPCVEFAVAFIWLLLAIYTFHEAWFRPEQLKDRLADAYRYPDWQRLARSGLSVWIYRIVTLMFVVIGTLVLLSMLWNLAARLWQAWFGG